MLIEIGIAIEIGLIGETFDNDPDPDPDFDFDFVPAIERHIPKTHLLSRGGFFVVVVVVVVVIDRATSTFAGVRAVPHYIDYDDDYDNDNDRDPRCDEDSHASSV